MIAILVEMQAKRAEMNALRHGGPTVAAGGPSIDVAAAPIGAAPIGGGDPIGANNAAARGGAMQPRIVPHHYIDLWGWCGMSLEQFAGIGAPIEAADWLSAATGKLDAF